MPQKIVTPNYTLKSFTCPHCGVLAQQHQWGELTGKNNFNAITNQEFMIHYTQTGRLPEIKCTDSIQDIFVSVCTNCKNPMLWKKKQIPQHPVGTQTHYEIIYPITPYDIEEPNESMPEDVKALYNEARSIAHLSTSGAFVLLRKSLELFLKNEKFFQYSKPLPNNMEPKLYERIKDAIIQHPILKPWEDSLDLLRNEGNEGAHGDLEKLHTDREDCILLFDILNKFTADCIEGPQQTKERLEKHKQAKEAKKLTR